MLPVLLTQAGCSTLAYYAQAVQGQLGVVTASRPLPAVIGDPTIDSAVRQRLQQVPALLAFAEQSLGLPDDGSYRRYVDLQRDAMVWSVVAAPPDSLQPRTWCYPVIGCASYRGYFERSAAQLFAAGLAQQGLDVAIEPVPAYSTLGWFNDPLPSTVIEWPEAEMAGLVFHELAHQKLYVPGDSAFNEAYATLIEQEGVRRWLAMRGDQGALHRWQRRQQRRAEFLQLLEITRARLSQHYAVGGDPVAVGAGKQRILQALRADYLQLRARWDGHPGYDAWFDRPLNNAHFASVNTYHGWVPALQRLLRLHEGDLDAFHARCRELADMQPSERTALLRELATAQDSG